MNIQLEKKINFRNSSLGNTNIKDVSRTRKDFIQSMKSIPCKLIKDHMSNLQGNVTDVFQLYKEMKPLC